LIFVCLVIVQPRRDCCSLPPARRRLSVDLVARLCPCAGYRIRCRRRRGIFFSMPVDDAWSTGGGGHDGARTQAGCGSRARARLIVGLILRPFARCWQMPVRGGDCRAWVFDRLRALRGLSRRTLNEPHEPLLAIDHDFASHPAVIEPAVTRSHESLSFCYRHRPDYKNACSPVLMESTAGRRSARGLSTHLGFTRLLCRW
jgi:hypothetical protein